MLKKIAPFLLLMLIVAAIALFAVVPGAMDRSMNSVTRPDGRPAVAEAASALHRQLFVADLHADPLLWKRDLSDRLDHGHVDLPRLEQGNVGLQVFGVVTKTPRGLNYDSNSGDSDNITLLSISNLQPVATWGSLYERALYQAGKLEALQAMQPGRIRIIRTRQDLAELLVRRETPGAPIGALLGLEGAHALEGRLENLRGLYDAGFRMLGLAHFFDNEVAGSMHGVDKYGLTELGKQVVRQAEDMGMTIDIAHSSPATIDDVLSMATRPVVVSHTGVQATCQVNRNLSDAQIQRIAANGGVIGIGYWDAAVCDISPAAIVDAMDHVRNLVGMGYIALGSDFDGATNTSFDTGELILLTDELLRRGYSETRIHAIMGGNVARLLRNNLPAGH